MFSGLFVSTIPPRIQAVAIIASIALLLSVVYLIRHEKLKEGYSIVWFLVGLTLVLFSVFTRLLDMLSVAVGIRYSPSAFFLIVTGGLFLLALHFSVLLSRHDRHIRELAQENALLKERLERLRNRQPVAAVSADFVRISEVDPVQYRRNDRRP